LQVIAENPKILLEENLICFVVCQAKFEFDFPPKKGVRWLCWVQEVGCRKVKAGLRVKKFPQARRVVLLRWEELVFLQVVLRQEVGFRCRS
jgi:hypothetical protein